MIREQICVKSLSLWQFVTVVIANQYTAPRYSLGEERGSFAIKRGKCSNRLQGKEDCDPPPGGGEGGLGELAPGGAAC